MPFVMGMGQSVDWEHAEESSGVRARPVAPVPTTVVTSIIALIRAQARSRYEHARGEFLARHGVTLPPWHELDEERRAAWSNDTAKAADGVFT